MARALQRARAVQFAFRAVGALFLNSTASCGSTGTDRSNKQIERYQLCPKSGDARVRLNELAKAYAAQQQAQVTDHGSEAQNELAGMDSAVLRSTNLPVVLLTIEKPSAFRISITNLGLREKFALSVRLWDNVGAEGNAEAFLHEAKRFWSIEPIEGGVLNDPPCPTS